MAGPVQMPEAYPHGMTTLTPGNTVVEALSFLGPGFEEVALPGPSNYIKPKAVMYDFQGKQRRWDVVESHPSVGVVLYHKGLDAWLIVRQFRPALYAGLLRDAQAAGQPKPKWLQGFTYELCAGLIDKAGRSPAEICREEILEECGFDVPLEAIRHVSVSYSSVGTQGAAHIVFYAEVDASMQREAGGGLLSHGECIEVLALPLASTLAFVVDDALPKSPGLMFALTWAYHQKVMGQLGVPSAAAGAALRQAAGSGSNGSSSKGAKDGHDSNPLLTQELVLKPVLPA